MNWTHLGNAVVVSTLATEDVGRHRKNDRLLATCYGKTRADAYATAIAWLQEASVDTDVFSFKREFTWMDNRDRSGEVDIENAVR